MRKAKTAEYLRLETVMERDRLAVTDDFNELLRRDLERVAAEYFELKSPLAVEIKKENGEYRLSFRLRAKRAKNFFVSKDEYASF